MEVQWTELRKPAACGEPRHTALSVSLWLPLLESHTMYSAHHFWRYILIYHNSELGFTDRITENSVMKVSILALFGLGSAFKLTPVLLRHKFRQVQCWCAKPVYLNCWPKFLYVPRSDATAKSYIRCLKKCCWIVWTRFNEITQRTIYISALSGLRCGSIRI